MKVGAALLVLLLPVWSCSEQDPGDPDSGAASSDGSAGETEDAGVTDPERSIEVGTGRDGYEPLMEGQTVEIVLGPQGGGRIDGYHIWGGLKALRFAPERATITFTILDAATREPRASQTRIVPLEPLGDGFVAYGLAPRITDCCLVEERAVIMRAEIEDSEGKAGADERPVRAASCLTASGARACP